MINCLNQIFNKIWNGSFYGTKMLPLEHDVVVNFTCQDNKIEVIHELEKVERKEGVADNGYLKIVLNSLVRKHGVESIEQILNDLKKE